MRNRLRRALWGIVEFLLFRPTPRPFHAWRAWLLRLFGAQIGRNCHIYAKARIWAPWNLRCDDMASIADEAIIYNPKLIRLGHHSIVSQQAYLCGATHDYNDPDFPLVASPITLGPYAWVCARASVQPGVSMAEGAVLGMGGVATGDLEAWTVYGGVPAKVIGKRAQRNSAR